MLKWHFYHETLRSVGYANLLLYTLEDNIRFKGAITILISDYAQVEISNKVKDILRMYHKVIHLCINQMDGLLPQEGEYQVFIPFLSHLDHG